MTRNIGILIFDGVEVLDFAGPYEVFACAARVSGIIAPDTPPPFRVSTIGKSAGVVRARAGLNVLPEADFSTPGKVDVLIVPGGVVTEQQADPAVTQWIAAMADRCELVASVCNGAILLAQAGLLEQQDVTTHWADIDELRGGFPRVRVHAGRRWIDNGRIVTSAGISAGIDMSLHLVERLASRELAVATAHRMEYHWRDAA